MIRLLLMWFIVVQKNDKKQCGDTVLNPPHDDDAVVNPPPDADDVLDPPPDADDVLNPPPDADDVLNPPPDGDAVLNPPNGDAVLNPPGGDATDDAVLNSLRPLESIDICFRPENEEMPSREIEPFKEWDLLVKQLHLLTEGYSMRIKDEDGKIIGSQHELNMWHQRFQHGEKTNQWIIEMSKPLENHDGVLEFLSGVAGMIVPARNELGTVPNRWKKCRRIAWVLQP